LLHLCDFPQFREMKIAGINANELSRHLFITLIDSSAIFCIAD